MRAISLLMLAVMAGAGCAHTQQPPERKVYVISDDSRGVGGAGGYDCAEEQIKCFDRCWNRAPPLTSIKRGSGKHHEYCTEECRKEYNECVEEQEQLERERKKDRHFSNIDTALEWLRKHNTEVAIGTVVVVAGVAFVVATGGGGALILAPLAL